MKTEASEKIVLNMAGTRSNEINVCLSKTTGSKCNFFFLGGGRDAV